MAIRTYLDSNILIYAYKGTPDSKSRALRVLREPDREFVSSIFVKLETLPIARYGGQGQEELFYRIFFASIVEWLDPPIYDQTFLLATRFCETTGMSGIDALHVAAATQLKADEFITAERPTRAMFRATSQSLKILSITPTR